MNGVAHGVPPRDFGLIQRRFQQLGVAGEILVQVRAVVEADDEHLVLGLDAFTSASEAAFTLARLSRMLPLLSMTMPMETGTSRWVKALMGCSTPFS